MSGLAVAVSYVVVLLPFALPWIREATHAFPAGALLVVPTDGPLIAWILGWVCEALRTTPWALFDAPINHPAPAQLAGTEHFMSSQLVFLPVYHLTGNALLGANVVAMASYPLAGVAMQRLLQCLGGSGFVAWMGGLLFALGPMRVPTNLQLIQYQNVYLALVALALTRLRARPVASSAVFLGVAFTLGVFSSYYLAVMLALLTLAWTAMELGHRTGGRRRYLALVAAATGVGGMALAAVSAPYVARSEATGQGRRPVTLVEAYLRNPDVPGVHEMATFVAAGFTRIDAAVMDSSPFKVRTFVGGVRVFVLGWFGVFPLALAVCGLAAFRSRCPAPRLFARRGLTVCALAAPLIFLPVEMLAGRESHSLLESVVTAPLRVVRYPFRFAVLTGFGTALLGAAALEAVRQGLGRRAGLLATTIVASVVVGTRGPALAGRGMHEVAPAPIYDVTREIAASRGPGPLLELPLTDLAGRTTEPHAMLGALRHGLPLVTGSTGYPASHRRWLDEALSALPEPAALARLVDLTHARWLLLRPPEQWRSPFVRESLLAIDWVVPVATRDGWVLAMLDRAPGHPEWYRAVAAGGAPTPPPLHAPSGGIQRAPHRDVYIR